MSKARLRPSEVLRRMGGWSGGSIGQVECLAGIDIQSPAERWALWQNFRALFGGDSQGLIDAVSDHCATIVLARVKRGELSLLSVRN